MSPACFEFCWFLKIKCKFLRVAHNEVPSKTGHGALQLSFLSPAMTTFCFGHVEIAVVLHSLLFLPSASKGDGKPPSFTLTTPLPSDISLRRFSLNPGPHLMTLLPVFPAPWKLRARGHLYPDVWKQWFWSQLSFCAIGPHTVSVQQMLVWWIRVVSILLSQHAGCLNSGAIKINESEVIWGQVLWLLIPVVSPGTSTQ